MKAMLFAAGLGTRLRPLTDDKPKALVEIEGKPLLEIAIERLMAAGCREVIVNVHHFAGKVIDFLEQKKRYGIRIAISDEREKLLDTGGGLKKASWFFEDGQPFLVCNVDILTNLDLGKFYRRHCESGALATLAVRRRSTSRYLLLDDSLQLRGWQNVKTRETRWCGEQHDLSGMVTQPFAFSGIQALQPAIFEWMPADETFPIMDVYLRAAAASSVKGYLHDEDFWLDVGKPEAIVKAIQWFGK